MENFPLRYRYREKALLFALWLNFEHRLKNDQFGMLRGQDGSYLVVPTDHPTFQDESFEKLPKSLKKLGYDEIQALAMDDDPLTIFEDIQGMFSTMQGEHLRFILKYQIPLERFIRYELSCRGYDMDNRWCGFEKAKMVWLK